MSNELIVLILCVFASVKSQQRRLLIEEDLALQVQKLTERLIKLEGRMKCVLPEQKFYCVTLNLYFKT